MAMSEQLVTVGLYGVGKTVRRYNCRNSWLRRDLLNRLRGRNSEIVPLTILRDISFEVRLGESVALLGINGSGKSTLLKLIAGIYQPTDGRILRNGTVCTLFDVGTGFQEDLTGRENVFINGAILGLGERFLDSVLGEIAGFAEIEGFMDTPLRYYSSGMRARLGFAVAMHADPDIFLIDEVLAVGDEGFRRKCYKRLDRLISGGTTVIMVSHDTEAVKRLCSRAIWLYDGRVRADGPASEVCQQYVEHFNQQDIQNPVEV